MANLLLLVLFAAVLWLAIKWAIPKILAIHSIMGVANDIALAESWARRLWLRLTAAKTVIVSVIGSAAVSLPQIIKELSGIDLSPVIGSKYAGIIGCLTALAVIYLHLTGVKEAAETEPAKAAK